MAAPDGPALPWGRGSDGASQQSSDTSDEFASSLRKIMLTAALGGLPDGPPAKRARTDDADTGDALARACHAVEACRALAEAEDTAPTDLAAGQRIQVCSWCCGCTSGEGTMCAWRRSRACRGDVLPARPAGQVAGGGRRGVQLHVVGR